MFEHPDLQGICTDVLEDVRSAPAVPTPEGASLGVRVDDRGAVARVILDGELDLATSGLLDAVLGDLLRRRRDPRVHRLQIDTSAVAFVDAAGISPLLHARAVLTRRGGLFELPDPSPSVRRLLRLLGLDSLLVPALETPA